MARLQRAGTRGDGAANVADAGSFEAKDAEIARLREDYADSQERVKALEDALRHIEGLALADEPRDLKNIAEVARAAALLEKS